MFSDMQTQRACIGVISDTHGFLHPAVPELFQPVARIIHAGDIGTPEILEALGRIAPVTAVRGNMDYGNWASALPPMEIVTIEGLRLCVLHDRTRLQIDPRRAQIHAVISGHTHHPHLTTENGIQFINPGSASHPRHRQSATVVMLDVVDGSFSSRLIELDSEFRKGSAIS
jgi:putative phosphoesterase